MGWVQYTQSGRSCCVSSWLVNLRDSTSEDNVRKRPLTTKVWPAHPCELPESVANIEIIFDMTKFWAMFLHDNRLMAHFYNDIQIYPHFFTSQASKADVQRAQGTWGTFVLPHVSLTFFASSPHTTLWRDVTQNVRVTWGTFILPHVLQMPCT